MITMFTVTVHPSLRASAPAIEKVFEENTIPRKAKDIREHNIKIYQLAQPRSALFQFPILSFPIFPTPLFSRFH